MRILVTGSSGFLGSHLCQRLKRAEHQILAVGRKYHFVYPHDYRNTQFSYAEVFCDITNEYDVSQVMSFEPDLVFHLAGNPNVRDNDLVATNIVGTYNILKKCKRGTRFVFASSATVYSDVDLQKPGGASEADIPTPASIYGACKVSSESLVTAFDSLGIVSGLSLRLVANVGSRATHGVLYDLARKLLTNADNLEIIGAKPGSAKQYVHVNDTVDAMVLFGMGHYRGVLNLSQSANDIVTVDRLADILMEELDVHKPKKWLGENSTWPGDNKIVKVSNLLAWSMRWSGVDTETAIRRAVGDMCGK